MTLSEWERKMQDRMRQVSFRDFVKYKMSWKSLVYNKHGGLISLSPRSERIGPLIAHQDFSSQRGSFLEYGINYDPKKGFFEQFSHLMKQVPVVNLVHYTSNDNANYGDCVLSSRNVYLSSTVISDCENIFYSMDVRYDSSNVFNSMQVINYCENVYHSIGIQHSFNIFYSKYINNCNNVWFGANLTGCSECLMCHNMDNVSYCFRNQQYSKDDYMILKKKFLVEEKDNFERLYEKIIFPGANHNSSHIQGQAIVNSQDIEEGYLVYGLKGGKNVWFVGSEEGDEDFVQCFLCGRAKHMYGINDSGGFSEHCYHCSNLIGCMHVYYSTHLDQCSNCLGCIGLQNKTYCILNKQYSKEEWYEKVDKIFGEMEKTPSSKIIPPVSPLGTKGGSDCKDSQLGEFFPGYLNPFYFNDTVAYLIDPSFSKEEVTAQGYLWRDEPIKVDIPEGVERVKVSELAQFEGWRVDGNFYSQTVIASETKQSMNGLPHPQSSFTMTDNEWYISDEILKKVIVDEQGNVYRIAQIEYDFLMKYGLPLPKQHWLARLKSHFAGMIGGLGYKS